ncbi:MAG: universal stress protein [Sedimenticola sp.]
MTNYQHILIAVDFTPEAERVTARGRELAAQNSARLSIIHVVEYSSSMYAAGVTMPEQYKLDEELVASAAINLKELALTHSLGDAKQYVELGVPKLEIIRVAEEQNVDLIVTGSHGRHGLQLLLGSTANGVLHLAKCDVLAVRVGS